MSYRLAVMDELPQAGLLDRFENATEFDQTATALVEGSVIEDASKLWWNIRPSSRVLTLEMRVVAGGTSAHRRRAVWRKGRGEWSRWHRGA